MEKMAASARGAQNPHQLGAKRLDVRTAFAYVHLCALASVKIIEIFEYINHVILKWSVRGKAGHEVRC